MTTVLFPKGPPYIGINRASLVRPPVYKGHLFSLLEQPQASDTETATMVDHGRPWMIMFDYGPAISDHV